MFVVERQKVDYQFVQVMETQRYALVDTQLAARGLLPDEHIMDSGYMASDHVMTSQKHERFPLWTNFQNARVFQFGKRATSWRRPQNISYEEQG